MGWDKLYFLNIGPTEETLACTMLPYETEGAHVHFGTLLADAIGVWARPVAYI